MDLRLARVAERRRGWLLRSDLLVVVFSVVSVVSVFFVLLVFVVFFVLVTVLGNANSVLNSRRGQAG